MTHAHFPAFARTPDPIMAELWEVKRQINEEAGYRLEELARMAKQSADKIRSQWLSEDGSEQRGQRARPAEFEP